MEIPFAAVAEALTPTRQVYNGENHYLTVMLIEQITQSDTALFRFVLPIRDVGFETKHTFTRITFDSTQLPATPEESVSRMVSMSREQHTNVLVRRGLALMLEHGFMRSPVGKEIYAKQLAQIRNATMDSLLFTALDKLLDCRMTSQRWYDAYGSQLTPSNLSQHFIEETERFGILQKSNMGWELLDGLAKQRLELFGRTGDTWLVPRGMLSWIAYHRGEAYFQRGENGVMEAMQKNRHKEEFNRRNNCSIFEIKAFQVPGSLRPVQILSRRKAIGDYFTMMGGTEDSFHRLKGSYRTNHRTIFIYSESDDAEVPIDIFSAVKATNRFYSEKDGSPPEAKRIKYGDSRLYSLPMAAMEEQNRRGPPSFAEQTDPELTVTAIDHFVEVCESKLSSKSTTNFDEIIRQGVRTITSELKPLSKVGPASDVDIFTKQMFTDARDDVNKKIPGLTTVAGLKKLKESPDDVPHQRVISEFIGLITEVVDIICAFSGSRTRNLITSQLRINDFFGKDDHPAYNNLLTNCNLLSAGILRTPSDPGRPDEAVKGLRELAENYAIADEFTVGTNKTLKTLGEITKTLLPGDNRDEAIQTATEDQVRKVIDALGKAIRKQHEHGDSENGLDGDLRAAMETKLTGETKFLFAKFAMEVANKCKQENNDDGQISFDEMVKILREIMDTKDAYGELPPPGEGEVRQDFVKGIPSKFKAALEAINLAEPDILKKIFKAALLGAQLDLLTIEQFCKQDLPIPFGVVLYRPFALYEMQSAIILKAGRETGEVLVSEANFTLGDDPIRKIHVGNFTCRMGAALYQEENVYVARDVLCTGYHGGCNGVLFQTPEEWRNYQPKFSNGSIFARLVPYDIPARPPVAVNVAGTPFEGDTDLYGATSDDWFKKTWGIPDPPTTNGVPPFAHDETYNTTCFRGFQRTFSYQSMDFSNVQTNMGHWGPHVFPGVARYRAGIAGPIPSSPEAGLPSRSTF